MNGSITTALKLGAALFLTLALIGIGVNLFNPATEAAKTATTDFSNTTTDLKDQKYLIFDDTTISGSQVMNALRRFEKEAKSQNIAIQVKTGKNPTGVWYYSTFASDSVTAGGSANLTNATSTTHVDYINPSGMFDAKIVRDSNLVIRAIIFTQQT